jgi:deoxyadenosine/deoxycytidine kinase
MSTHHYIAVEGNIGAGKSTLAGLLADHYGARLVLEEFADNTFLPKFYAEPERYAFPLEMSFLADRYQQLRPMLQTPDLFGQPVVSDYVFQKSKLFARINLTEAEYQLFQSLFQIINPNLPQPDVLVFLQSPIDRLQRHIAARGRSFEQRIPDAYLEKVAGVYEQFIKHPPCPTIVVDAAKADFLAPNGHLEQLLELLAGPKPAPMRYLTLD